MQAMFLSIRKVILPIFFVILLFFSTIFLFVFAQSDPILSGPFSVGMKSEQVSVLQKLLSKDSTLYPEQAVTGFYGAATTRAVERFQSRYGLVSNGTPSTTGYGLAGPSTRAKMREVFQGAGSSNNIDEQIAYLKVRIKELQEQIAKLLAQKNSQTNIEGVQNVTGGVTGTQPMSFGNNLPLNTVTEINPSSLVQPHMERSGINLAINPSFNGTTGWATLGDAVYDPNTSRTQDGSGSYKLTTPYSSADPKSSVIYSNGSGFISVTPGKTYTLAAYIKTEGWPNYISVYLAALDSDKKYIENRPGSTNGTTADGKWEEIVSTFTAQPGDSFVQLKVSKGANPTGLSQVWIDDFYFGEGVGFEKPPSLKIAFNGSRVRVDSLGNIELNKNGTWVPFFPFCMYSDNYRDLSVYSKQGWNCNIWAGSAYSIQAAKKAVSSFNPDGMMSGFQLANYTALSGYNGNDKALLQSQLQDIKTQGLMDHLLFYYLDNENNWDDWTTPQSILNLVKTIDFGSTTVRQVPIYALQGTYGAARTFSSSGLVDINGTYVGIPTFTGNNTLQSLFDPLGVLGNVEGQTNPVVMAQFNDVVGAGEMRQRLYNSIIHGARGMGYWRDCFGTCLTDPGVQSLIQKNLLGPVDQRAWWADLPNLRREVDVLISLIRQPHWTTWSATLNSNAVLAGTRDYQGEGYLFVVNQTTSPVLLSVNLQGMTYTPTKVVDFFTGQTVAQISNNSFSFTIPALGIKSGTGVYRLVR